MQAMANEPIRIGNVAPVRDFNYIADTVRGFLLNATSEEVVGRVINLGTGTEISIGNLAKTICSLIGAECRIVQEDNRIRPSGSEVERLCADNSLAGELIGWRPEVSLNEGLQKTLSWIRSNLDYYQPEVYAV
jgi:nucleoside-diphosphate-sugar epimerase